MKSIRPVPVKSVESFLHGETDYSFKGRQTTDLCDKSVPCPSLSCGFLIAIEIWVLNGVTKHYIRCPCLDGSEPLLILGQRHHKLWVRLHLQVMSDCFIEIVHTDDLMLWTQLRGSFREVIGVYSAVCFCLPHHGGEFSTRRGIRYIWNSFGRAAQVISQ